MQQEIKRQPKPTELARHEATLALLVGEENTLKQEIEVLKTRRAAAVLFLAREMAHRSPDQTGATRGVMGIEDQIRPAELRLEGLGVLIQEAQGLIATAKTAMKAEEQNQAAKLANYISEQEQKYLAEVSTSVAAQEERIVSLYVELCTAVAELQIATIRLRGFPNCQGKKDLADLLFRLPVKVQQGVRARKFAPLMSRGYAMDLPVWPLVPGTGVINPSNPINPDVAAQMFRAAQVQQWTEEFYNQNNGKRGVIK